MSIKITQSNNNSFQHSLKQSFTSFLVHSLRVVPVRHLINIIPYNVINECPIHSFIQGRPSPLLQRCISLCFTFPPVSEKNFGLRGKFSRFDLSQQIFRFSSAKFLTIYFLFPYFNSYFLLFREISLSLYFCKNIT